MAKGVGFYNKKWFSVKENKELIAESIIRILLTSPGERVMRPGFGVGLNRQLFSLITPDMLQDLAVDVHNAISNYESRVNVVDVQTEVVDDTVVKIHIFMEYEQFPGRTEELTLRYTL